MRIGLVLERLDPQRGGLERWAGQFATALANRGIETHVLAFGFAAAAVPEAVACHVVPWVDSRLERARLVNGRLAGLDLDLIHDCGVGWQCDVLHLQAGSRRAAFERSVQSLPPWRRLPARILRRASRNVREMLRVEALAAASDCLVLAPSRSVADDFERVHGPAPGRLRVVPNGVDVERFSPARREAHREGVRRALGLEDQVLFLAVARNPELKGVPVALQALAELRRDRRPVHLAVLGSPDPDRYTGPVRRLGIERETTFAGAVDDPVPYYAAADAFVHPTRHDACSLVVLEAWAGGLPVVTTRFDGAAELMAGEAAGFVIDDAGDARAVAGAMRRLLDPSTRERCGQAARRLALSHTFDQHVDTVIGIYAELRDERRGGHRNPDRDDHDQDSDGRPRLL